MFKRVTVFLYGLASYAVFFATYLYAIGFVANLFVPRSIDSPRDGDLATHLLIDLALLTAFAMQHSVMARPGLMASLGGAYREYRERVPMLIPFTRLR